MTQPSTKAVAYRPGERMCDALFSGPSALRNRDKTYSEGPIETLRGVMSNDFDFLMFKDRLSRALTQELPASVDDGGRVSGNGVRSNFYGLRYVGGYPQTPATYPLVDNSHLRQKESLSNEWVAPWHRNVLTALTRLFFRDITPVPLKLRNGSSSMMPFYTKEMPKKQELARYALANGQKAAKMMMAGDYINPWTQFYIGGAYHTVYRRQSTDAMTYESGVFTPKPRPVADLEYALSGGRSGEFKPADRSMDNVDFRIPKGFFRERNRTAMGGPLGLNVNLMIIAQAVRAHIYAAYPYTYHHTTRSSQEVEMRKMGYIIAADVSNHDWFWPTFTVDTIAAELLELGYAEWWVHLFKTQFKLPNYVTDVGPDEGNVLLGSWTDPQNNGGLPSGTAFTDLLGTMVMTTVYFILQVEHTYPELIPQLRDVDGAERALEKYLRGELSISLKDKSDDALLGWPDSFLHARAAKLHEAMKEGKTISPYMKVSYEHGFAFLGSVVLTPANGDFRGLTLIGNVNSAANNMFSPEYGVQSGIKDRSKARRPYPGLAWKALGQNYGTAPAFTTVMEIIEREWGRIYGTSYRVYREEWLHDDERRLMDDLKARAMVLPDLTPIELEILQDPGKLEWKYGMQDVSQSIVDMLFNGLPLSEVEPYFKEIYHGS